MDTKDKIIEWLLSDDTCASSIAIVAKMTGFVPIYGYSIPYDQEDFGRCHRLLEKMPEFKVRIEELSQISAQWAALIENWEKLTAIYFSDPESMTKEIFKILRDVRAKNVPVQ
jgi:hypothetical protein